MGQIAQILGFTAAYVVCGFCGHAVMCCAVQRRIERVWIAFGPVAVFAGLLWCVATCYTEDCVFRRGWRDEPQTERAS
jgi:hypothetical protein